MHPRLLELIEQANTTWLTPQNGFSQRTARQVEWVIATHYHGDHVGGNEAVGDGGAVIIAHDNIRKRMSTDQFNHFWNETTPAWPKDSLPVVTFNDRVTLAGGVFNNWLANIFFRNITAAASGLKFFQ